MKYIKMLSIFARYAENQDYMGLKTFSIKLNFFHAPYIV